MVILWHHIEYCNIWDITLRCIKHGGPLEKSGKSPQKMKDFLDNYGNTWETSTINGGLWLGKSLNKMEDFPASHV
jgi:hypothetical protein